MEERVGEGKGAFLVRDRRGEKKEPREEPAVELSEQQTTIEETKDKSSWQDVSYTFAMIQPQGMPVITILRAVGLRSDDRTFIADWIVPPFWTDMREWQTYVTKRLDTFLGCKCVEGKQCVYHRDNIKLWQMADSERFEMTAKSAMPPSLEAQMRAEMAREKRVVAPGR